MKKLPTVGGGTPTPFPRSVATLPRAWSLRSLTNIVPPKYFGSLRHCPDPQTMQFSSAPTKIVYY